MTGGGETSRVEGKWIFQYAHTFIDLKIFLNKKFNYFNKYTYSITSIIIASITIIICKRIKRFRAITV